MSEFIIWSHSGKPIGYLDQSHSETLGIMQRAGYILQEVEEL